MEDLRAIELYTEFRRNYHTKRLTDIVAVYELSDAELVPFSPMETYVTPVSDLLRQLSNSVNELRRHINMLAGWAPVYDSCEIEEQLSLLVEHIIPISALALGAPQALRGRIMFAAATGCRIANAVLYDSDPKLQWTGGTHLDMKLTKNLAQPWESWPRLAGSLGELHKSDTAQTGDYRNQREHGHPLNIGIGLTFAPILPGKDGRPNWNTTTRYPVPIETVISTAETQHSIAIEAYQALCALAQEQHDALLISTRQDP